MKKILIGMSMAAVLLLGSCGTYTGQGAYMGASIGGMLGSAIGGYSGGWRGSDMGTIVGMAGGAVVGAAVGSAEDRKAQEKVKRYRKNKETDVDAVYDSGVVREARKTKAKTTTPEPDDRIDLDLPGPQY